MSLDYEVISVNEESREARTVQKRDGPHQGGPPQIWIQSRGPLLKNPIVLASLVSRRRRCSCAAGAPIRRFIAVSRVSGFVNLDRALKVRAVLDHDPRGRQIADHRAILLDLDAVARSQIPLHVAVDHDFAGDDICRHFSARADCQFAVFQLNQPFDCAVDVQVLIAGDFALDVQSRTEPRNAAR